MNNREESHHGLREWIGINSLVTVLGARRLCPTGTGRGREEFRKAIKGTWKTAAGSCDDAISRAPRQQNGAR